MKSKLKLKLLRLEDFIEEIKSGKTDEALKENIRLACQTIMIPTNDSYVQMKAFSIILTTIKSNGVIVEYEEETGRELAAFADELAKLAQNTNKRKQEVIEALKKSALEVKYGRWVHE